MRTLLRTLEDRDVGFLRVICELWGFDFPSGSNIETSQTIAAHMSQPDFLEELIESLPDSATELIGFLSDHDGKLPFAQVNRSFGPLREMGPGRRDREQPWREPASALEVVWYRGLLGRAFADTSLGPQEFVYLPSDLLELLGTDVKPSQALYGHPADTPAVPKNADTSAVDDATTLMAAFRRQPPLEIPLVEDRRAELVTYLYQPPAIDLLAQLLVDLEYLQPQSFEPVPSSVGSFLEADRGQALHTLIAAWRDSHTWNDLAGLPHLHFTAPDWPNDPNLSRSSALNLLRTIQAGEWWDIGAFIHAVKQDQPAFQRPGGDFDSWYLQDGSGAFLNGIEHWESVDGAFLRFLIKGPLHWLGLVDLGFKSIDAPMESFRLSSAWGSLFDDDHVLQIKEPDSKIIILPNCEVIVPRGADRVTRYQIARISDWEAPDRSGHHFRLTPGALEAAAAQGLSPSQILLLLEKTIDVELPPSMIRAVERWSESGTEAQLGQALLLRVEQPEILDTLSKHKSTSGYLAEILTPTIAVIRESDWPSLRDAAARLGLLLEPPDA